MGTFDSLGKCTHFRKSVNRLFMLWYRFYCSSPLMWCWYHATRRDTKRCWKNCSGGSNIPSPNTSEIFHLKVKKVQGQITSKECVRKDVTAWLIVVIVLPWSKYLLLRERGRKGWKDLGMSFEDTELSCTHCKIASQGIPVALLLLFFSILLH